MQPVSSQRILRIRAGTLEITARLADSATADALWNALPLQSQSSRWGDEIYFIVPFTIPLEENAQALVKAGDVAYWPDGPALCFFFGPTPVSRPGEIRAASPVNICAAIEGDCTVLRQAADGARVILERSAP